MEFGLEDASWGVSLGSVPEERRGKKQEWSKEEVELQREANDRPSQSMGSSEARMGLWSCPESSCDGQALLRKHQLVIGWELTPGTGWP